MLSILLPVNSHSGYFLPTIKSLSAATSAFKLPTELIVVLNGVLEKEEGLIRQDLESYPFKKIVIFSGAKNLAQVLNEGIEQCSFEFVARIDQDDICDATRFILQFQKLLHNENIALVGGQVILINSKNDIIGKANYPTKSKKIVKRLESGNCFAHPAVMFRKSAVIEVGGYRNDFPIAEDYDLWVRLSKNWLLSNLSSVVISYRIHPSQVSSSRFNLQLCSTVEIMAEQANLLSPELVKELHSLNDHGDREIFQSILETPCLKNHKKFLGLVALMIFRRSSAHTQISLLEKGNFLRVAFISSPVRTVIEVYKMLQKN